MGLRKGQGSPTMHIPAVHSGSSNNYMWKSGLRSTNDPGTSGVCGVLRTSLSISHVVHHFYAATDFTSVELCVAVTLAVEPKQGDGKNITNHNIVLGKTNQMKETKIKKTFRYTSSCNHNSVQLLCVLTMKKIIARHKDFLMISKKNESATTPILMTTVNNMKQFQKLIRGIQEICDVLKKNVRLLFFLVICVFFTVIGNLYSSRSNPRILYKFTCTT